MLIFMLASDEKYVFMKVTGYAQNRPMQMRTFLQANFVFFIGAPVFIYCKPTLSTDLSTLSTGKPLLCAKSIPFFMANRT